MTTFATLMSGDPLGLNRLNLLTHLLPCLHPPRPCHKPGESDDDPMECRFWDTQWPFQVPKLEVPTIHKAYVVVLCKGTHPQSMALYYSTSILGS